MEVLVLALALLVVGAGGVWLFWLRGGSVARARRHRVAVARRSLRTAEKSHKRAVRAAERALASVEKERARTIGAAERDLARLESPTGSVVDAFATMILYERFIQTRHGVGSVVGAHASVDTAGNLAVKSRATLTRMAAGGLLLGPLGAILSLGFQKQRVVDTRELYILVETPEFASVAQCDPDKGAEARAFAALVNTTAAQAEITEGERPKEIKAARERLRSIRAETTAVDEARRGLTDAQSDTERVRAIEAARAELEAAQRQEKSDEN